MKIALMVAGMHRSGTSALSRVLNFVGATLPEHLMPPDLATNEAGFWEPKEIVHTHDELLRSAGTHWDDYCEFPSAWYNSPSAETYVKRLANLVQSNYGDVSLLVLKDPRICRLVPLWTRVLERLEIEPAWVLPIRNPLEVAASLKKRDGFAVSKSVLLWLRHVLDAERDTRSMKRSFVTYEMLVGDPSGTLSKISEELQMSWPRSTHRAILEAEEFLNPKLHHNHSSREELSQSRITPWIEQTYELMLRASERGGHCDSARLDEIREEFRAAEQAFGPLLVHSEMQMERLSEQTRELEIRANQGDAKEHRIQDLERQWIVQTERIQVLERQRADQELHLSDRESQIGQLKAAVDERDAKIQAISDHVTEIDTQLGQLRVALKERESRISAYENELLTRGVQSQDVERQLVDARRQLTERETVVRELERVVREQNSMVEAVTGQLDAARAETRAMADQVAMLGQELALAGSSKAWALAQTIHRVRKRLAPTSSKRHHALLLGVQAARVLKTEGPGSALRKAGRRLRGRRPETPGLPAMYHRPTHHGPIPIPAQATDETYATWIARNEPDAAVLAEQREAAKRLRYQPLISVLTPVLDTPPAILSAMIWSMANQTYDRWELCIADGGSTNEETRQVLAEWSERDPRVKVVRLPLNRGISGNTNAALELAKGDFLALLDHDDMLPPFAMYEVARRLEDEPDLDFLYSDKDLINADGTERFWPLFKPSWSPEVMLNANYLTHLTVMRTSLVHEIGGWRPETDGAQDWDVFLRVLERTERVGHIPKVLYHWRLWGRSVASGLAAKPYVIQTQELTLNEHLRRTGHDGKVVPDPTILKIDPNNHMFRFRPEKGSREPVSVVVLSQVGSNRLPALLDTLLGVETDYEDVEVVVVHRGPKTPQLHDYHADLKADPRIKVVDVEAGASLAAARDAGASVATGHFLLFLSEGLQPISRDWLAELVQTAKLQGVGAVGAKLMTADDHIEHAGLVIGLNGLVCSMYAGVYMHHGDVSGSIDWYRNYSAVSGECLMIRRDLYEELGGFDSSYQRYGWDVDLCLKVGGAGHRVVYTPFARLRRVGKDAPTLTGVPREDLLRLYDRCLPVLTLGDRYYNVNLATDGTPARLRVEGKPETAQEKLTRTLEQWKQAQTDEQVPQCMPDAAFHEGQRLATMCNFTAAQLENSRGLHATHSGPLEIQSINWFIPPFQNAYYGGIYTILRFASHLKRTKGVQSRFYVIVAGDTRQIHDAIASAFPNLHGSTVQLVTDDSAEQLNTVAYADACISTLWSTAYYVLKFNRTRRKFYFVQDAEPLFYPAGSTSALAEVTYRFGFYGITNTVSLRQIYEAEHGGVAQDFTPCVDTELFHPDPRPKARKVHRVFYYGRPNNPRNGFELGCAALRRLKDRLGDRVEILAAGDRWRPEDYGLDGVVTNLGLMRFDQTAELYRTCDVGLVMMFTRHPSYLPFEFMASGCLVVTNRNAATTWLLKDGKNCLLTEPSADCIAESLERGLADEGLRKRITANALDLIVRNHSDWRGQIEHIFAYMCNPDEYRGNPLLRPLELENNPMRAAG